MTKMTFSEVKAIANEYAELTFETRGSHSYACGAFETMLSYLVAELPKHKQAEFAAMMKTNIERETARLTETA